MYVVLRKESDRVAERTQGLLARASLQVVALRLGQLWVQPLQGKERLGGEMVCGQRTQVSEECRNNVEAGRGRQRCRTFADKVRWDLPDFAAFRIISQHLEPAEPRWLIASWTKHSGSSTHLNYWFYNFQTTCQELFAKSVKHIVWPLHAHA